MNKSEAPYQTLIGEAIGIYGKSDENASITQLYPDPIAKIVHLFKSAISPALSVSVM